MKTITIPLKEYECLRGHLNKALEIFQSLGVSGDNSPGSTPKRETKAQKEARYDNMIITGERGKKPDFLKAKSKIK